MISRTSLTPKDRLCLALDVSSVEEARLLLDRLAGSVGIIKIGYRLGYAGGLALAKELADKGQKVFIDLKLHDIDNTVAEGVRSLDSLGASLLTVHAYPKTMRAAVAARGNHGPALLGVTVLTSMDDTDLDNAGYAKTVQELVTDRALHAKQAGMNGLVCSANEAGIVRKLIGKDMLIVTPGIRPTGARQGDQKRVMTPELAIKSGADILVIGRPILQADNPKDAAEGIIRDIETALEQ